MMPLTFAAVGEENMIKKVGGKAETRKFLENLGFVAGAAVTVISQIGGNVIVNVKARSWFKEAEKMATLKEARIGQTVRVKKLNGEGAVKRRIMDMGITKGTEVYIRKVAPLGDPIEVTVRGYELSLRKADAEMIETE